MEQQSKRENEKRTQMCGGHLVVREGTVKKKREIYLGVLF